jgi:hypothetical protein
MSEPLQDERVRQQMLFFILFIIGLDSNHQFYEKVRIESEISIIGLQLSRVGAIDNFCQTKIVILMDRPQDIIGRDLAGSILFKH